MDRFRTRLAGPLRSAMSGGQVTCEAVILHGGMDGELTGFPIAPEIHVVTGG